MLSLCQQLHGGLSKQATDGQALATAQTAGRATTPGPSADCMGIYCSVQISD